MHLFIFNAVVLQPALQTLCRLLLFAGVRSAPPCLEIVCICVCFLWLFWHMRNIWTKIATGKREYFCFNLLTNKWDFESFESLEAPQSVCEKTVDALHTHTPGQWWVSQVYCERLSDLFVHPQKGGGARASDLLLSRQWWTWYIYKDAVGPGVAECGVGLWSAFTFALKPFAVTWVSQWTS